MKKKKIIIIIVIAAVFLLAGLEAYAKLNSIKTGQKEANETIDGTGQAYNNQIYDAETKQDKEDDAPIELTYDTGNFDDTVGTWIPQLCDWFMEENYDILVMRINETYVQDKNMAVNQEETINKLKALRESFGTVQFEFEQHSLCDMGGYYVCGISVLPIIQNEETTEVLYDYDNATEVTFSLFSKNGMFYWLPCDATQMEEMAQYFSLAVPEKETEQLLQEDPIKETEQMETVTEETETTEQIEETSEDTEQLEETPSET